jgi:hypothetical protein
MNLADKIGALEPLRQHAFRMYITSTGTSSLQSNSEQFELAIRDTFTPNRTTETIEIDAENEKLYYAGKTTYDAGSVVIRDYVDADVVKFLTDWENAVYNPATGIGGYKSQYAGEAIIQQYAPDGSIVREWKLKNIWPESVDHGSLTMGSADPVEINCSFRYDRAIASIV